MTITERALYGNALFEDRLRSFKLSRSLRIKPQTFSEAPMFTSRPSSLAVASDSSARARAGVKSPAKLAKTAAPSKALERAGVDPESAVAANASERQRRPSARCPRTDQYRQIAPARRKPLFDRSGLVRDHSRAAIKFARSISIRFSHAFWSAPAS